MKANARARLPSRKVRTAPGSPPNKRCVRSKWGELARPGYPTAATRGHPPAPGPGRARFRSEPSDAKTRCPAPATSGRMIAGRATAQITGNDRAQMGQKCMGSRLARDCRNVLERTARPIEPSCVDHGAPDGGAVAVDELAGGMDHHGRAMLAWSDQFGGRQRAVDDERDVAGTRQLPKRASRHVHGRIANGLDK